MLERLDIVRRAHSEAEQLAVRPGFTAVVETWLHLWEALVKLQIFLYILLRDHLPFGTVEAIIAQHVEPSADTGSDFSEQQIAGYAASLAARLRDEPPKY